MNDESTAPVPSPAEPAKRPSSGAASQPAAKDGTRRAASRPRISVPSPADPPGGAHARAAQPAKKPVAQGTGKPASAPVAKSASGPAASPAAKPSAPASAPVKDAVPRRPAASASVAKPTSKPVDQDGAKPASKPVDAVSARPSKPVTAPADTAAPADKPSAPLSKRITQPVPASDAPESGAPEGETPEGETAPADVIEAAQEEARKSAAARALRDQRQKAEQREATKRRRRRHRIVVTVVALLVLVLATAVAGAFSWFRWLSVDDLTDIKGTWYLSGTNTPITITNDRIQLTENVAYRYTIDPQDKTIMFSFGSKTGSGFYRFSLDRDQLALVDGEFTGADTLWGDFSWTVEALLRSLNDEDLAPSPPGTGVTLLSREPARGSAPPPNPAQSSDADDAAA